MSAANQTASAGTVGAVSSFEFPSAFVVPGLPVPRYVSGGEGGVPGAGVAGSISPDGGSTAAALSYGQQAASRSPVGQPIFWGVVAFALGVALLGHAAHVEVRS